MKIDQSVIYFEEVHKLEFEICSLSSEKYALMYQRQLVDTNPVSLDTDGSWHDLDGQRHIHTLQTNPIV